MQSQSIPGNSAYCLRGRLGSRFQNVFEDAQILISRAIGLDENRAHIHPAKALLRIALGAENFSNRDI